MSRTENQRLRHRRQLLQNPYAHIEQLEEQWARGRLENPYVYAQQSDSEPDQTPVFAARDLKTIEQITINLQRKLWAARSEFGLGPDVRPVDVLQPEYAARLLGYDYSLHSSLGSISQGRNQIVVAGLIDQTKRLIEIATDVEPRAGRFTAAHEIGHAALHPHQTGLHRDRPINGATQRRDRAEYEADKFASFFLMPCKLLTEEFLWRFLQPFALQEDSAVALLA